MLSRNQDSMNLDKQQAVQLGMGGGAYEKQER